MARHRIAMIAADDIGQEVVPERVCMLRTAEAGPALERGHRLLKETQGETAALR